MKRTWRLPRRLSAGGRAQVTHELPFTLVRKYESNLIQEERGKDGGAVGSCVDAHGDSERVSGQEIDLPHWWLPL